MKKMLLLTLSVFVAAAVSASASTCASDPLSTYDMSGFSCTLGDLTFSDFVYTPIVLGGATAPADTSVQVTPVTGTESGFEFSPISPATFQVGPGQTENDYLDFSFTTSNPIGITDIDLVTSGSFTGNGTASVLEDTPAGNLFTQFASGSITPSDSMTFSPVGSLTVQGQISLVGGSGVAGAGITNLSSLFSEAPLSTVPEPSLILVCLCALGLVPVARRKLIH